METTSSGEGGGTFGNLIPKVKYYSRKTEREQNPKMSLKMTSGYVDNTDDILR